MEQIIGVVGLGYVGLPLAIEFSKKYRVVGFDTYQERVNELQSCKDHTKEADLASLRQVLLSEALQADKGLVLTDELSQLRVCNIFIIAVPTPINSQNDPDLKPLLEATANIGSIIKRGDIVIYESTVYPGCTEEMCVPVLEEESGLRFNVDFFCGYSPERINPGDKINTLTKIKKITSGSTPEVADKVDALYNSILENGTHKAPNMKVAEAAKAVENAQRDVNISFMNELALICDKVGVDTNDVIDAASTKWNFVTYRPGLVGGHCISVDPYYLAHKAKQMGYQPEVILSGRRVNNSMPHFIAHKVLKMMIKNDQKIMHSRVLILGVTFKENCPDVRNTKVVAIGREMQEFGCEVDYVDPWADAEVMSREYGVTLQREIDPSVHYQSIIVCVAHSEFKKIDFEWYKQLGSVIFDVKGMLPRNLVDARL